MKGLLGSFTAKLVLSLTILIVGLGIFYLVIALITTKGHLAAIDQSLNRDVARYVADGYLAAADFDAGAGLATEVLSALMNVNPNAEIYLLDGKGVIVSHAAPAGRLKANSVAIEPVLAFLERTKPFPLYGDDPRDPESPKIFSAAAVGPAQAVKGYVYVVLGGDAYSGAARMFQQSYVLRLSSGLIAVSVVAAFILGGISFYRLTAPLRGLAQTVSDFEPNRPFDVNLVGKFGQQTDDEVAQLARSFGLMAQRIADQIKLLKDADGKRREFMVYVSHDLKTPIASIRGYLETLQMKWEEMESGQRTRYLDAALQANDRILNMVEAILELSMLEGSEVPLHCETFSITELVQDVCQKLHFEAEKACVGLAVDRQNPNVYLTGDIGLLERALVNVIENALKFSDQGTDVTVSIAKNTTAVRISISNRGQTIKPEELSKIFRPFYRGKAARQNIKGHGLGLPIAKRIVELHDGTIAAESDRSGNTVFTLALKG